MQYQLILWHSLAMMFANCWYMWLDICVFSINIWSIIRICFGIPLFLLYGKKSFYKIWLTVNQIICRLSVWKLCQYSYLAKLLKQYWFFWVWFILREIHGQSTILKTYSNLNAPLKWSRGSSLAVIAVFWFYCWP